MANALFGFDNLIDRPGTVLTAGSQRSNLPVSNLADPDPQRPWVTLGTTKDWAHADFGTPQSLRLLGLFGALCTPAARVRWRLGSTPLVGETPGIVADVLDTGWVSAGVAAGYWSTLWILTAAVSARSLRVDVDDPDRATTTVNGQAPGDLITGRLWASNVIQPLRNFSYPLNDKSIDSAAKQRGRRSGAVSVDPGPKYREVSFGYEALSEVEGRGTFKEFLRKVGITDQIVFVPDPGGAYQATEAMLGRRTENSPVTRANFAMWSNALTIEEDPALGA